MLAGAKVPAAGWLVRGPGGARTRQDEEPGIRAVGNSGMNRRGGVTGQGHPAGPYRWLLAGCLVLFAAAWALFLQAEADGQRADDQRRQSQRLADDWRESAGTLTWLAQSYLVSGDAGSKQRLQALLDLRDGKSPGAPGATGGCWALLDGGGHRPQAAGPGIPLLERLHLTPGELAKARQVQAACDAQADAAWAAVGQADAGGADGAVRLAALGRLMEPGNQVSIRAASDDFNHLVAERTQGEARAAQSRAHSYLWLALLAGLPVPLLLHPLLGSRKILDGAPAPPENSTSDAPLAASFAQAAVGMGLVAPDGRWLRVNPKLCQILGDPPDPLLGRPFTGIYYPDDRHLGLAGWHRLLERPGDPEVVEGRCRRWDGSLVWTQLTLSLVRRPDGTPDYGVAVLEDIQVRKDQDARVQRDARYLRGLIESSLDPLLAVDRDGRITDANPAAERTARRTRAELVGGRFGACCTEPDQARLLCQETFANGRVIDYPLAVCQPDGQVRHLSFNTAVFYDSQDSEGGLVATARDVTASKAIEAELEVYRNSLEQRVAARAAELAAANQRLLMNEASLKAMVELSQAAADLTEREVLQLGLDQAVQLTGSQVGYLHFLDEAHRNVQLLLWSRGTLPHCHVAHEDHYPLDQAGLWADSARTQAPVIHNDFQALAGRKGYPTGHVHLIRHLGMPLVENGQVPMVLGVGNKASDYDATDVRELGLIVDNIWRVYSRRRAEIQLAAAKAVAEAANRAKSQFLANMSHELRTPLNAILGFSDLMGRDPDCTPTQRENLHLIHRGGRHLLDMINNVLDLTKIDAGRIELDLQPLDLYELLDDIATLCQAQASEKGLRFVMERLPGVPRHIRADPARLRQILLNLLGNALKFTDRGEILFRVGSHALGGQLRLRLAVQDTGCGIPAPLLGQIFAPFTQVAPNLERHSGTGLGLTISRHLAELMGGTLWAESRVDQGSTFTLEIPTEEVRPSASARAAAPVSSRRLAPGQPEQRVLVADDQPESRLRLREILEGAGFSVREADTGEAAISLFRSWNPYLIWMEMAMPVMDGYQATRRIRRMAEGRVVQIIGVTASSQPDQESAILAVGCDGAYRKPYRGGDILDAMARHLRLKFTVEPQPGPASQTSQSQPAGSLNLKSVPASLIEQLTQAAILLDVPAARNLINQIRPFNPQLADGLDDQVRGLRFDAIVTLCDQINSGQPLAEPPG